jgi:DMSO/TMAO reductase YedYZ molybdopterin-dependent catalytic subunit
MRLIQQNHLRLIPLLIIILVIFVITSGCVSQKNVPGVYGNETENLTYQGQSLTPIANQDNNAINGTQYIDRAGYRLQVDGLVKNPLSFTYDEILAMPQTSKVVDLNCVEGWNFTAKWTGVKVSDIFNKTGIVGNATTVIFYCADGYSTSLDLSYKLQNNIILAYKDNDITLPPDRGFPLQLIAESKYGYKWAKWITRIEVSNDSSYRGYWEKYGYNNKADVGGPKF